MKSLIVKKNCLVITGTFFRIQKTRFFRPKYYLIDPDNRIIDTCVSYKVALNKISTKINILKVGRTTYVGDFYECRYNRRLGAYVLSKDGKELSIVEDPRDISHANNI